MNNIPFIKMHGLGNDFVIVDNRKTPIALSAKQLRAISDRNRGVGCDQFIILSEPKSPDTDVFADLYNNDGFDCGACGNATRCIASIMINETGKEEIVIETNQGILKGWKAENGMIRVNMGQPRINWDEIPLAKEVDTLHVPVSNDEYSNPTCVSMGNPHAVFLVDDANAVDVAKNGSYFETHEMFPEKTNVEFVSVINRNKLRMRVWERASGITQACGTGACASLVAAARLGVTDKNAEVVLDGGSLFIEWADSGDILMTGAVATSFTGVLDSSLLENIKKNNV
jgi:diaminopimelate epimerase